MEVITHLGGGLHSLVAKEKSTQIALEYTIVNVHVQGQFAFCATHLPLTQSQGQTRLFRGIWE